VRRRLVWLGDARLIAQPQNYRNNQHLITGFNPLNWIRFRTTGANPNNADGNKDLGINLDVHDVHNGRADSWMFYGDSITANQWAPGSFTQLINAATGYYPAASNGGVPFVTTNDAVSLFDRWLPLFPGTYVGIAYGTNDASGVAPSQFYSNMKALVDKVLARGKVPIIPTIPWASPSQRNDADIRALNAQIARLKSEYGGRVLDGPDLYSTLQNRPDLLTDGLHPNDAGNAAVSASRACDRAVSAVTVMKALSTGFKRSMRARQAFVCSTGDTFRDRTQLARLE
jgi:lysophospholipase L1-like esterase